MPTQALSTPNATAVLLACLNPTAEHTFSSLATLGYARRAGNLRVREQVATARPEDTATPIELVSGGGGGGGGRDDPDANTALHRRCDYIETSAHGELYARCAGDPSDPLVLYVHDPHEARSNFSEP